MNIEPLVNWGQFIVALFNQAKGFSIISFYICISKLNTGSYSKLSKFGHFDAAGWVQGTFLEKKGIDETCKLI